MLFFVLFASMVTRNANYTIHAIPVFYLIEFNKSCAKCMLIYCLNCKSSCTTARGCFQCTMTLFLAVCVVLLHNQLSTSNKVDNGKHVSPFLSRHIRGALPTDLNKSPSIDSQPPQWLQHYCFGQPDTSSSTAGMGV